MKKYIAKEWVEPPTPKPAVFSFVSLIFAIYSNIDCIHKKQFDIEEELRKEKEKKRNKSKTFQTPNPIEVQVCIHCIVFTPKSQNT